METFILGLLLGASVIGLTFIVERGFALRQGRVIPASVRGALETYRRTEDLPMLRRICEQNPSPLSRLLAQSERNRHWPRAENASALETSARHEVSRMERGLVLLEIIVGVAPLLGLVGTVYGLIAMFASVGATGLGEPSAVSRGIAYALNATLFGLLTAIPSLVAWSYYSKKVEHLAVEMASLCDNFLRQLYHGEEADDIAELPTRKVS
jgi:biopolymer transport protein ExbB